jgi:hypothetical protein
VELPATLVDALKEHRAAQDDYRKKLGAGYHENDLVVCVEDGSVWKPVAHIPTHHRVLLLPAPAGHLAAVSRNLSRGGFGYRWPACSVAVGSSHR